MRLIHRPIRGAAIAVLGLAVTAMTGAFAASASASGSPGPRMVALSGNPAATGAAKTGSFSSSQMTVSVALAPRSLVGLQALLQSLYTPGNKKYQQWLAKGQFDRRFGPAAATTEAVEHYLSQSGLTITNSGSPFLVSATGSSQRIAAAFGTSLSTYRGARGTRFFANSTAARMPASLASNVLGVLGLNSAVREHDMVQRATSTVRPSGRASASSAASKSCETGYPTDAQLFDFYNDGNEFPQRLRRRAVLQRPHADADQLPLRRAARGREGQGQGRHAGRVRALGLPVVRHHPLGALRLRQEVHPAAGERER